MKKLMTAFAVCLTAGLVSAVESLNIVGYQTLDLPTGYKMMTSTFVPVGGTALRLGDITPNANFSGDNGDIVQFFNLNGNGSVVRTANYYAGFGWFDFDTSDPLDNMTIPAGTGMFVSSSQAGVQFQIAGEVALPSFGLAVASGYTVVGNSSPKPITLGSIVPNANFSGDNGDIIQFFNPNGNGTVVRTANYYAGFGWFDFDTSDPLDSLVLNPGDAFFASASLTGVVFTFPAVL